MASGEPVTVSYHAENGVLIADRYTDAADNETQPASALPSPSTATATPNITPTSSVGIAPLALGIEPFASGFRALTFLANAGDGTGQLYAVEQRGVIWRVAQDGTVDRVAPFLDISDHVGCCDERGLLGLAFHPEFATNGRFFVDYTDRDGNTVVAELARGANGQGDPASERKLLGFEQPFPNHNGGMLAFGPDGYLYISTGDGGSGGDPMGNGQDRATLLGKILRIDIDNGDPYEIPEGNPFKTDPQGGSPEIWDWGLRNPWRFSFDRQTGDLWIGDVGQDMYEELDAEPAGQGGRNYGWNVMEGNHCFGRSSCPRDGLTLPVAEYDHSLGCSVTGGYVYRGSALPQLGGQYVFADYCSGGIWTLDAATAMSGGAAQPTEHGELPINTTSFGEDEAGELYLVSESGEIYRLVVE